MNKSTKCIAGSQLSVGCMVSVAGQKKVYAGRLFKPWTWLKWELVNVVVPTKIDHVAVINTDA